MAVVALGAMTVSKRPFAEFGFCRPVSAKDHFKLWGLALGAASTGVILAFDLRGMQGHLAAYGLRGIVLWIWVITSIVEEVFCRGWFQSLCVRTQFPARHCRTRLSGESRGQHSDR